MAGRTATGAPRLTRGGRGGLPDAIDKVGWRQLAFVPLATFLNSARVRPEGPPGVGGRLELPRPKAPDPKAGGPFLPTILSSIRVSVPAGADRKPPDGVWWLLAMFSGCRVTCSHRPRGIRTRRPQAAAAAGSPGARLRGPLQAALERQQSLDGCLRVTAFQFHYDLCDGLAVVALESVENWSGAIQAALQASEGNLEVVEAMQLRWKVRPVTPGRGIVCGKARGLSVSGGSAARSVRLLAR
jgi:hypothetical protein